MKRKILDAITKAVSFIAIAIFAIVAGTIVVVGWVALVLTVIAAPFVLMSIVVAIVAWMVTWLLTFLPMPI